MRTKKQNESRNSSIDGSNSRSPESKIQVKHQRALVSKNKAQMRFPKRDSNVEKLVNSNLDASEPNFVKVTIRDVASNGFGVGVLPSGRTVFVEGALTGESLLIEEIYLGSKHVSKSQIMDSILQSEGRQVAPCPAYDACGGCQLLHANPQFQLSLKVSWLFGNLRRIGKWGPELIESVKTERFEAHSNEYPLHYRNRIRLHFDGSNLGFYSRRSNTIISAKPCKLPAFDVPYDELFQLMAIWWQKSRKLVERNCELTKVADIELTKHKSSESLSVWIILPHSAKHRSELFSLFLDVFANSKFFEIREFIQLDHPFLSTFEVHPESFIQPHQESHRLYGNCISKMLHLFYKKHGPTLKPDLCAWDLYSGSGTWSILPSLVGSAYNLSVETIGVEGVPLAIESFKRNYKNHPNISGIAQSVEQFIKNTLKDVTAKKPKGPSIILVDPPRAGLGEQVTLQILKVLQEFPGPKLCIFISCDSACLARDVAPFLEAGLTPLYLELFDTFGGTVHFETILGLEFTRGGSTINRSRSE